MQIKQLDYTLMLKLGPRRYCLKTLVMGKEPEFSNTATPRGNMQMRGLPKAKSQLIKQINKSTSNLRKEGKYN